MGYRRSFKPRYKFPQIKGRKPTFRVGYNSHGGWSTLGEIRAIELDRGNDFPKGLSRFPDDTPAIWVCPTCRKALRYVVEASDWEHVDDEAEPLTASESEMLRDISAIPMRQTDIIAHDDGDEGYLLLRP